MVVPEFYWHCSRDSEVIGSDILEVLLSLSLCRRNAPNYRQNDGLLETCFSGKNFIVGNSLRYFNNIWRKSLVAKANMKVFRIRVWIWICVSNMCLNNNSSKLHNMITRYLSWFKTFDSKHRKHRKTKN